MLTSAEKELRRFGTTTRKKQPKLQKNPIKIDLLNQANPSVAKLVLDAQAYAYYSLGAFSQDEETEES